MYIFTIFKGFKSSHDSSPKNGKYRLWKKISYSQDTVDLLVSDYKECILDNIMEIEMRNFD